MKKTKENGMKSARLCKEEKTSFIKNYRETMCIEYACVPAWISRQTYYNYRREDETFNLACKEAEERITDLYESALINAIRQ